MTITEQTFAKAERVAEVVQFLAHKVLVPKVFAHKMKDGTNIEVEGQKFDLNSDIAVEKVQSSYRFHISRAGAIKLVRAAEDLLKAHNVAEIIGKFPESDAKILFAR